MAIGMRYFTLQVNNALALAKECQDAGYEVVHPGGAFIPDGPGPQCTFAMVRDPDGNLIEFAQGSPWAEPSYEFAKLV
jgi:catechol 2,3-dioxygenase-like lactoylglutathione lyase family enzyme